jgi:hypothetical protein
MKRAVTALLVLIGLALLVGAAEVWGFERNEQSGRLKANGFDVGERRGVTIQYSEGRSAKV